MVEITIPFRHEMDTAGVRGTYRSTLPLPILAVDKSDGGKTDALNAGINVAKYPYVLLTDAAVVMDGERVLRAMRHVVEDRRRTIAVGGNIRPVNARPSIADESPRPAWESPTSDLVADQ